MIAKDVKIIEYPARVERWNTVTHAVGVLLGVAVTVLLILKSDTAQKTVASVIYGLSFIAVYAVSAVYHGLPTGEAKRIARVIDHSTVPLLIAGTSTPCALVTLYEVSFAHCVLVTVISWFCFFFGMFAKLFFFKKLRAATMTVYIVGGGVMLASAIPLLDRISIAAFSGLLIGCLVYVAGAILCGLGIKRPALHAVFHLFVLAGSLIHFYTIYSYVI